MVYQRKGLDSTEERSCSMDLVEDEIDSGSDSTSDDDFGPDIGDESSGSGDESEHKNEDTLETEEEEEEEEDELIKAIRQGNQRVRDHPPVIKCDDHIVDISFHPSEDLLGVASITGNVFLYKYTNNENTLISNLELHTKACRDIEFSQDGETLFSTSKDKSIMLTDVTTGKLKRFYDKSHEAAPYCLTVLDEHLFATGDELGIVKVWDLRVRGKQIVYFKKNSDFISDIISGEARKYLICSSGDGSLTTYDLQQRCFLMQSEDYDDELTSLGLFRSNTKLLASSSKGRLYLFNWHEFGLHSDIFPGPKAPINALIPITENIVVTASEDGNLRASHLFPHRHLGIVGQHDLSAERLDMSNNGQFIVSSSHDDIKFWNIQYFEDFEAVSEKHNKNNKKRELEFNLPSSKRQNVADFFKDL